MLTSELALSTMMSRQVSTSPHGDSMIAHNPPGPELKMTSYMAPLPWNKAKLPVILTR